MERSSSLRSNRPPNAAWPAPTSPAVFASRGPSGWESEDVKRLQIAPSILTADFGRLAHEVSAVEDHVDWFHLDVMDGHYVDNLTFGPSTVEAINQATDRPLHVHLMITDPGKYARVFAEAGA